MENRDEETTEQALKHDAALRMAAAQLREVHGFESVQIIATRSFRDAGRSYCGGTGSVYARLGACEFWVAGTKANSRPVTEEPDPNA